MTHYQTNFRAEDFVLGSTKDRPAAKKSAAEPKTSEEPKQQDPNAVPDGTVDEVNEWVGDDAGRARKALAAEKKSDDPRVTLVESLEKVIEDDKATKKAAAAEKKAAEKKSE